MLKKAKNVFLLVLTLMLVFCNVGGAMAEKAPEDMVWTDWGMSYDLLSMLNGYNVIAFGDADMTIHCVGALLIEGDLKIPSFADGVKEMDEAVSGKIPPSYIKGYCDGVFNGRNDTKATALYVGPINKVVSWESNGNQQYSVNGIPAGMLGQGSTPPIYVSDDYFNFELAKKILEANQQSMVANAGSNVVKPDRNGTITVNVGDNVIIESLAGVNRINIIGDHSDDVNTTISILDEGSILMPTEILHNGNQPKVQEWYTDGSSIVWNYPNVDEIIIPSISWVGHVIAPNAHVNQLGGNYNGTIICNSLESEAEGHIYRYGASTTAADEVFVVTKIWNDGDNAAGKRPPNVKVELRRTGTYQTWVMVNQYRGEWQNRTFDEKYDEIELNNRNGWSYVWEDLPATKEVVRVKPAGWRTEEEKINVKATYYLKEVALKGPGTENYTTEYDPETGVITNNMEVETITISGKKTWNDELQDHERGKGIVIRLLADNEVIAKKTFESWVSPSDMKWEFTDLPKYKNGKEIKYTIEEEMVDGYLPEYSGYDVINNVTDEAFIKITGKKIWNDNNNQDGMRPASITIELLQDGKPMTPAKKAVVSEKTNWEWSFEYLPKSYTQLADDGYNQVTIDHVYSIHEVKVPEYETQIQQNGNDYTVTNTHEVKTVNLSGTKTWVDNNNAHGLRPQSITIWLTANGIEVENSRKTITPTTVGEEQVWSWTYENLPKYKNGREIKYAIREMPVLGYTTSYSEDKLSIINTEQLTSISGTKSWMGDSNYDGVSPVRPQSITVKLKAVINWQTVDVGEATASAANNWTYSFDDLPVYGSNGEKIQYTVEEVVPEGYSPIYEGYDITNRYGEYIDIYGQKQWNEVPQGYELPETITLQLSPPIWQRGEMRTLTTTSAEEGWNYRFTDLPKKDDQGNEITYTVTEVTEVDGFISSGAGTAQNNYTIVNTYNRINIPVEKIWSPASSALESATVKLLANGEETGDTLVLSAENQWKGTFENLDKKDENGNEIQYSVTEDILHCDINVTGDKQNGFKITNTLLGRIILYKQDENGKGLNGAEFKLFLDEACTQPYSDEKAVSQTIGREDGKVQFDNIPVGTYYIKEVKAPDNYTLNETVFKAEVHYKGADNKSPTQAVDKDGNNFLKNKKEEEKASISVTKVWNDSANNGALRPEKIQVQLYNTNNTEGTLDDTPVGGIVELPATAGNWSYTWNGLDKYVAGTDTEIVYRVDEVEVPDGYFKTIQATNDGFTITNALAEGDYGIEVDKTLRHAAELTEAKTFYFDLFKYKVTSTEGQTIAGETVGEAIATQSVVLDAETVEATTELRFPLEYGENWFLLKERADASDTSITYADNEYIINIWAAVDMNGNLGTNDPPRVYDKDGKQIADEESFCDFTFENTYNATRDISVTKVWANAEANAVLPSIQVQLYKDGVEEGSVTLSAEKGWNYTWEDLPKYGSNGQEITYTVVEVTTDEMGEALPWTTEYVPGTATGSMDDGFTITNTKIADGQTHFEVTKAFNGTLTAGQFSFALLDENGVAVKDAQNNDIVVTNKADGKVEFPVLTFDTAGTYKYQIKEIAGNDSNIIYDGKTVNVEVTVAPQDGQLVAAVKYDGQDTATFTNTLVGETTVVLEAKKTLNGADYTGAEFAFELKDSNGTKETVRTVDGGKVVFAPITYTLADLKDAQGNVVSPKTFTYTISEVQGSTAGVTYSTDVYTAEVKVTYDADSKALTADVEYKQDGTRIDGEVPVFANTSIELVEVSVTKNWVGADKDPNGAPSRIRVQLYAGANTVGSPVTLYATDNWTYTWPPQPKYDDKGVEIIYEVDEVELDGYVSKLEDCDRTGGNFNYTITNTYIETSQKLELTIPVSKAIVGGDINTITNAADKTFEFALAQVSDPPGPLPEDNDVKASVTGEGDVTDTFGKIVIPYELLKHHVGVSTGSHEYSWLVSETKGSNKNIIYDDYVYRYWVTVTVDENGVMQFADREVYNLETNEKTTGKITIEKYRPNGNNYGNFQNDYELVDTVVAGVNDRVTFINTYFAPTEVELSAKKTLNGADYSGDEYTFLLKEGETEKDSVSTVSGGVVTLDKLSYTLADMKATEADAEKPEVVANGGYYPSKTFTYTIIEVAGTDANVIYDSTVYTAKVTVTCDASTGTLNSSVVYKKDGAEYNGTPLFANRKEAEKTSVSISKQWTNEPENFTGRPTNLELTLYSYTTDPANAQEVTGFTPDVTGKDTAAWTYTWSELLAEDEDGNALTYIVKEETAPDGYAAIYPTDENGQKLTYVPNGSILVNKYVYEEYSFGFMKYLDGQPSAKEFEFTLTIDSEDADNAAVGGIIENDPTGCITVGPMIYGKNDLGKTYEYTLKENAKIGYSHDTAEYVIAVDIAQELNVYGDLQIEINFTKNGEPVTLDKLQFANTTEKVNVSVTKEWANVDEGTVLPNIQVQLKKDGAVAGDLVTLPYEGAWSYTWKNLPKYDEGETEPIDYTVVEVIGDWAEDYVPGEPVETENGTTITNTKISDGEAVIKAKKTLNNAVPAEGQFTFQLLDANGDVVVEKTNDASGIVTFDNLTYTEAKDYTYTIVEVMPKGATAENNYTVNGMTYDPTEHTVTVEVKQEGTALVATVTYNGTSTEPPVFTNTYEAKEAELTLSMSKTLINGAELPEGRSETFTFVLADEAGAMQDEVELSFTKANGEPQTATFQKLTFDAEGTYKYTISEKASEKEDIISDTTKYVLEVKVDDVDGQLVATQTLTKQTGAENATSAEAIVFTNTYVEEDKFGELTLTATKAMSGREFQTGDSFTFTVKGSEGAPMPANTEVTIEPTSGTTAAVNFGKISFTEADAGKEYTYTIQETEPAEADKLPGVTYDTTEYTVKVKVTEGEDELVVTPTYANGEGVTITNTYANEFIEIAVTKIWVETDPVQQEQRPDSVDVRLYADGEPTDQVLTLRAANLWTAKFTDLQKYVTGTDTPIAYTVKEITEGATWTANYITGEAEGSMANGFTITNTNKHVATTQVDVAKVWVEANDEQQALRPDSVDVQLYADGVAVTGKVLTLTATDGWMGGFANLQKYVTGTATPIVYTVKEVTEGADWLTSYTPGAPAGNMADGYTITNTSKHVAKTEIAVTKVWVEANDEQQALRPDSVDVQLYADGVAVDGKVLTLTATDGWTGKFTDLVKYQSDNTTPIAYTVKEVTEGASWLAYYTPGAPVGDMANGFTITNTNTYDANGKLLLTGTKVVTGDSTVAEHTFTFGVFDASGTEVANGTNDASGNIAFGEIAYTLDQVGTHEYTVKETTTAVAAEVSDKYIVELDETEYTILVSVVNNTATGNLDVTWEIKESEATKLTFTNDFQLRKGNIGVVKVDSKDTTKGLAGAEFTVYTDAACTTTLVLDGEEAIITTGETGAGVLDDLPIGTYWVKETKAPQHYLLDDETVYEVTVMEGDRAMVNEANGAHVTNRKMAKLALEKSDRLNPDKKLPDAEYTLFTEEECENILELPDGTPAIITTGEDGVGELEGVPAGTYWVKETKAPEGYEVDPEPYKVVVPEEDDPQNPVFVQVSDFPLRGALSLSKTVVASSEVTDTFLFDIELTLETGDPIVGSYKATLNGAETDDVTFAATETGAKATVELKDGETLTIIGLRSGVSYTVTEQLSSRYDVTVNGAEATAATGTITDNGHSIVKYQNTLKETGFTVEKVWLGEDAGEIKLTLYANGVAMDPQPEVTRDGNTYSYENLVMKDENGEEIVYTVKETAMAGYTTTYQNAAPNADKTDAAYNGGKIINQAMTAFAVKKEWSGLAQGEMVPAIQLTLYCNGKVYTAATPTPDKDGWYTYADLPAYVDGEVAVYTVKEQPVTGFTTTYINKGENAAVTDCAYNGSTIVNSKIPQTGDNTPLTLWMLTTLLAACSLLGVMATLRKREN